MLKIHINLNASNFHLRIIGANSWHNRECLEALRNSTIGHFRGILWKGLVMAPSILLYLEQSTHLYDCVVFADFACHFLHLFRSIQATFLAAALATTIMCLV